MSKKYILIEEDTETNERAKLGEANDAKYTTTGLQLEGFTEFVPESEEVFVEEGPKEEGPEVVSKEVHIVSGSEHVIPTGTQIATNGNQIITITIQIAPAPVHNHGKPCGGQGKGQTPCDERLEKEWLGI